MRIFYYIDKSNLITIKLKFKIIIQKLFYLFN